MREYILVLGAALGLLAQTSQPPQAPAIHVTTRLVEVNVIVRNDKGPVGDLTRGDFTVLDQGKPQKIEFFEVNSVQRLERPGAPAPANTFTNRVEEHGETPTSATIVLLDGLNTAIVDQIGAKQQLIKFLGQVRPEDRVAVYLLSTHLRILSDFTSDSARLLALLKQYSGNNLGFAAASAQDTPPTGNADMDAFLQEADALVRRTYQAQRARDTCAALEAIANHVRRLPQQESGLGDGELSL